MHVLALRIELHIPDCRSLKAKRSVLRPIVEGLRRRHAVAVAETAHQETWQRAQIGVVAVSGGQRHAQEIIDEAERFVWSFPEVQVLAGDRYWLEVD
jgi:uncharacterized protein